MCDLGFICVDWLDKLFFLCYNIREIKNEKTVCRKASDITKRRILEK